MAKYEPLRDHLKADGSKIVTLSFVEIESIISGKLPQSARSYRPWWGNEEGETRHVQVRAWKSAGYRVEAVDQETGSVTFVRI